MPNDLRSIACSGLVRLETRHAGNAPGIGFAHLARPRQLNALTREMCEGLLARLVEWGSDESIACVVLDGEGERGFCSGGDVVSVAKSIMAGGPQRYIAGDALFDAEYRLMRALFEFPKPLVTWSHGITMGAGLGLAVSGSHRIVAASVRMAMPESRIGLFPDIGAAWHLGRLPGNAGPMIALAGVDLNAADALYLGIADWMLPDERREAVYSALAAAGLTGDVARNSAKVDEVIATAARHAGSDGLDVAPGAVACRAHAVARIGRARDVAQLRAAVASEAASDAWFKDVLARLDAGSPTSLHVGFEHFRVARGASLREVLEADRRLMRVFVRGHDFPEGVRATLIDKDRQPSWSPSTLDGVTPDLLAPYFLPGA